MPSWDVCLLSGTYKAENDGPVVELYGKTWEGKSIVMLYKGFMPYFFVPLPKAQVEDILRSDPEIKNLEEETLFLEGRDQTCTRITMVHPFKVPEYRNRFTSPMAADIPFFHRFIYDNDLGACVKVTGEEVQSNSFSVDIVVRAESFEETEFFHPDLKFLSFDIENSISTGQIYCIGYSVGDMNDFKNGCIEGDEKDILRQFVDLVIKEDPDIITGYNIDGYDIPHIFKRAGKLGLKGSLGIARDRTEPRQKSGRFWRINGRIIADAWWNAKMELRPKKETLNAIAKLVLNEEKLDVDPKRIDEEWRDNRQKVMDYCMKDAELALRILDKISVIDKNLDLANVSKLPLDDTINGTSSTLIDSILIREADRRSIAVLMTRHNRKSGKIEGGYVHEILPGIYHWVCVLDFKSMYPSIIIQNNICFTTLSPKGHVESPIGARFLDKNQRVGLLPGILRTLMEDREKAKKAMKEAEDPEEKDYYNRLQNAIKVLMNAVYGVFASNFYRFTNKDIGASITAFARENIKNVIKELEEDGLNVVYSDTDSVFFQSPEQNLDGAKTIGEKYADHFSVGDIQLEFEKVLQTLFSHGKKKRYVGKEVWPGDSMVIRGYETRRSDAFDLQSHALKTVFEHIMEDDVDGAIKSARDIIDSVLKGEVPLEKLVISRTCKHFSFYKNADRQVNVQAAKKMMAKGYEFVPGMKVSWIVTNSSASPQEIEPYIDGKEFEATPDWSYYAKRIASTVARVTDVFDWDIDSLLTGQQQSSLFQHSNSKSAKSSSKSKPVLAKKSLTLEDFM